MQICRNYIRITRSRRDGRVPLLDQICERRRHVNHAHAVGVVLPCFAQINGGKIQRGLYFGRRGIRKGFAQQQNSTADMRSRHRSPAFVAIAFAGYTRTHADTGRGDFGFDCQRTFAAADRGAATRKIGNRIAAAAARCADRKSIYQRSIDIFRIGNRHRIGPLVAGRENHGYFGGFQSIENIIVKSVASRGRRVTPRVVDHVGHIVDGSRVAVRVECPLKGIDVVLRAVETAHNRGRTHPLRVKSDADGIVGDAV